MRIVSKEGDLAIEMNELCCCTILATQARSDNV